MNLLKHKQMQRTFVFTALIVLSLRCCQAFNLEILDPDGVAEEMVFVDGTLTDYYNSTIYEKKFDCTNGQLEIIEFEESPEDEVIVLRYSGGDILSENDISISVEPNVSPAPYLLSLDKLRRKIRISAGCPDPITKDNYYNRVIISIKVQEKGKSKPTKTELESSNTYTKTDPSSSEQQNKKKSRYALQQPKSKQSSEKSKNYEFSFLLNCDLYDLHKNFQFGYIFLSLFGLSIVVVASMHPRIYSIRLRNNIPLSVEIKWEGFLALAGLTLVLMLSIYGQHLSPRQIKINFGNRSESEIRFQLANAFIRHLGLLASFFFVHVCMCQFFYEWQFFLNWVPFLNLKVGGQNGFYISKRAVVSFVIAFMSFILGLLSSSWIYYNLLCCFISVGAIKTFRFRSLRNATYTLAIVVASITLLSVWSNYMLPRAMNDYASELSSPLVLEVPDLVNNLYKKCSWLSVFDIVLPGATLAYLRDYDENYHVGWKGVYTFISVIAYGVSCFLWVIIEALIQFNVPFCVVGYPVFIGSILLSAARRNEFQTIWNGFFHFSMDMNALQLLEQYKSDGTVDLSHIFPKEIVQAIKMEESKGSESETNTIAEAAVRGGGGLRYTARGNIVSPLKGLQNQRSGIFEKRRSNWEKQEMSERSEDSQFEMTRRTNFPSPRFRDTMPKQGSQKKKDEPRQHFSPIFQRRSRESMQSRGNSQGKDGNKNRSSQIEGSPGKGNFSSETQELRKSKND